mmetsp:Transcript_25852/g.43354  ORF Transcript_25852/g.43354 Transcript_25852/m.43354 type:complete len:142 (+) Transcript_25852:1066-1491(+)
MGVLSDFSLEHSLAVTSTSPGLDSTPGLDDLAFTSSALGCSLGRLSSDSIDSSKHVSTRNWSTVVTWSLLCLAAYDNVFDMFALSVFLAHSTGEPPTTALWTLPGEPFDTRPVQELAAGEGLSLWASGSVHWVLYPPPPRW